MLFRLKKKAGDHSEPGPDGKLVKYTQGDLIDTENDLQKLFSNKFVRVASLEKQDAAEGEEDEVEVITAEEAPVVVKPPKKEAKKPVAKAPKKKPTPAKKAKAKPVVAQLGRNVTKRFPRAEEEDFSVFSDGGAFFVTESDAPNDALHDKPLKKKDVGPFIEKFLKS